MTLALAAALAGMTFYGAASVLQAVGAQRATGPAVVRQPAYLLGLVADGVAWLASLVALRQMSLFAVQSILAGSVAVTVLLAWALLGARPRRRDAPALLMVLGGLVGVAAAFGVQEAPGPPGWFAVTAWAGVVVVVAFLLGTYRPGSSPALAVVAGAAFAGAAVCARAVHVGPSLPHLVADPLAWAVAAFGVVGALGYARALEGGDVGAATAVLWVVEVLASGVVGVTVLGDTIRPGHSALAWVSVACALFGSAVLAFGPSARATAVLGHR